MRTVEVEGGSIDEAIDRALQALGAPRERVAIDILENATRGLLGLGRRRARVRATLRAPFALAASAGDHRANPDAATPERPSANPETRAPEGSTATVSSTALESAAAEASGSVDAEPASGTFDGATLLAEILRRMSLPARVRSSTDGATCTLAIESTNAAVIDACRDEVLGALELMVNRIAERQGMKGTAFTVAVARRGPQGNLQALARRLAERARARGKTVTVNALDEQERRIVVEALRAERDVTVRTTGTGSQRKLIIIPGGRRRSGGTTAR